MSRPVPPVRGKSVRPARLWAPDPLFSPGRGIDVAAQVRTARPTARVARARAPICEGNRWLPGGRSRIRITDLMENTPDFTRVYAAVAGGRRGPQFRRFGSSFQRDRLGPRVAREGAGAGNSTFRHAVQPPRICSRRELARGCNGLEHLTRSSRAAAGVRRMCCRRVLKWSAGGPAVTGSHCSRCARPVRAARRSAAAFQWHR
jgi:hypothetical protein